MKYFNKTDRETLFIHKVKATESEPALAAMENESRYFISCFIWFVLDAFSRKSVTYFDVDKYKGFESKNLSEKYIYIKQLHGELYRYAIKMQGFNTDREFLVRLEQLISATRNTMYAAKNLKDALPDIDQLKKSSNDLKFGFYKLTNEKIAEFYGTVFWLLNSKEEKPFFASLNILYNSMQKEYASTLKDLYLKGTTQQLNEVEFSTLINFNREMYTMEKSILFALKDLLLNEKEAESFSDLPGFIR